MTKLALKVMTWNVYLGADVAGVIGAPRERTAARMAEVWETARQTDFRIRARSIAAEIARRAPDDAIRDAQVKELLDGPARRPGSLLLTGDFNCDPASATWKQLHAAGYHDVWDAADGTPGFTSCQDPDLRNEQPKLYARIDWILCRDVTAIRHVTCAGTARIPEGTWPSDHAAVVATIQVRS
jgi:endonuclease/exonuclease/phosphatase (EEP) superfamily protein YafD